MRKIIISLAILFCAANASAQYYSDTTDPGVADELGMVAIEFKSNPDGSQSIGVDLYIAFDRVSVTNLSVGFRWMGNGILDSVVLSDAARAAFDFKTVVFRGQNRDSSNSYRQFQFSGVRLKSLGMLGNGNKQVLARYYFSDSTWSRVSSLEIDTTTFSFGTKLAMTAQSVLDPLYRYKYRPHWSGPLVIHDPNRPCCVNIMGNIDGQDGIDIGDQAFLIDHLFGSGVALPCVDAANVDGSADGSVDMADLIALTEHLFMGGQLAECR